MKNLLCFKFLRIMFYFAVIFTSQSVFASERTECVVFVCDENYFSKFLGTLQALTTVGNYHGDICLIIGNDLVGSRLLNNKLLRKNRVIIKHFPDFVWNDHFLMIAETLPNPRKLFHYHKFHVFNSFFKQWQTIFYIDSGMQIFSDIRPILDSRKTNRLLAHSDAYPTYVWRLSDQFDNRYSDDYQSLSNRFNLDVDYFQTGIMLYDTNIIDDNTVKELYDLAVKYPICSTHDQGIIALYFTNIVPVWKQIPLRNESTFFYDFYRRGSTESFIMVKY